MPGGGVLQEEMYGSRNRKQRVARGKMLGVGVLRDGKHRSRGGKQRSKMLEVAVFGRNPKEGNGGWP